MADIKLNTHDGLIEATIKQRQETYYLVTSDTLNSVKSKSLFCDLFLLIASLGWGAFLSTKIAIKSIPATKTEAEPNIKVIESLATINNLYLGVSILFTLLTAIMYWQSYNGLRQIMNSKVNLSENK